MCLEREGDAIVGLLKLKRMSQRGRTAGYHYKTPFQIFVLTSVFKLTNYPSRITRHDLAILLNISPRSIQIWLQNTRAALRDATDPFAGSNTDTDVFRMYSNKSFSKLKIVDGQDIPAGYLIALILDSCSCKTK